jgi:hypothetical protein
MDTLLADKIGIMVVDVIQFLMNLSGGYYVILAICFVGAIITIIYSNIVKFMTKPQY